MAAKLGKLLAVLIGLLVAAGVYLYFLAPQTAYDLGVAAERSLAGVEAKRTTVDGLDIAYLEGGEGETLVLLHGFGANKDNWTRMAAELVDDYRVIAPDLPGFGESDRPEEAEYGFAAQAERVHAIVEALGIERFHLAGNSMGGAVAGAYAAAHPERLRSLWLLAPAGVADAEPSDLARQIEAGGGNPLVPQTADQYYTLLDWVFADKPYIPAPMQYVMAQRAVARHDHYQRIFDQINAERSGDFALEKIVAETDVPVLVVWGEEDRLLHVSGARALAEAAPDRVRVERMPGVGHLPMVERPAESAEAFRAFATGLEQPPAADEAETADGEAAEPAG